MILHAGLIAQRLDGAWRGALITGSSGAGKTDLMLRALASGWRLVADDRTLVWTSGGRLYGRAPETLAGLVEVRGLGVLSEPALPLAEALFAVRCEPSDGRIERMPGDDRELVAGTDLPVVRLHATQASAVVKLAWAVKRLGLRAC